MNFIDRLDKPRKTGPDSWICRCPAHEDKSPSMTVRQLDDGRTLLHCFAGCSVENILGALGLTFDALFPPKPLGDRVAPLRKPFPAADALEAVAQEALIAQIAASRQARGETLTREDRARLRIAAGRIEDARRLANG